MRTCSIITAVVLSIIAVPMIIGSILANSFTAIVLTDEAFVAQLNPQRIQANVVAALPALLNSVVANPDDADATDIYTGLFPDPTMRAIAREQMPALVAGMQGDFSTASLTTTLDTMLPALMEQTVDAAPPCTADQESALVTIINTKRDLGDALCQPQSPATRQLVITYLQSNMTAALTGETLGQNPENPLTTLQMKDINDAIASITQNTRQGIIWPVTLIIIIMALAVRSVRGLFGWLGSLAFISGAGGLAIAALGQSLLTIDVAAELAKQMPSEYQIIAPFLTIFDSVVLTTYVRWLFVAFGGCAGLGGLGIVIALVLTPRTRGQSAGMTPLPGTPLAHTSGSDGITAPVPIMTNTSAIRMGIVTGELPPEQAPTATTATTDAHQFATTPKNATTSELEPPSSVSGDDQRG